MSNVGGCEFCGEYVEPRHAAYRVIGWETSRRGGGANRILGRRRLPNRVAHVRCAERAVAQERDGIAPDQGALL